MIKYIGCALVWLLRVTVFVVVALALYTTLYIFFRYSCSEWHQWINYGFILVSVGVSGYWFWRRLRFVESATALICLILGILITALFLTSFNNSRRASPEASALVTINNIRALAEMHYAEHDFRYQGVCENESVLQLRTAAESYFINDRSKRCLGTVWRALFNRAPERVQSVSATRCQAGDSWYYVTAELSSSDQYYCVDATGFAGRVDDPPAGEVCQE